MWFKITEFLLMQGLSGIAIICLGAVLVLFYKENKKERADYNKERSDCTERFIKMAGETSRVVAESTNTMKEMRDEIKQHNADTNEARRTNESSMEKLLVLLDIELKNRGRG